MQLELIHTNRSFKGTQSTYQHTSACCGTDMRFAIYLPPQAEMQKVPVLWFLSGLTCTEENATVKSGAQKYAAEHGIALVMPDTSPQELGITDENKDYDFGIGAGFYVDAIKEPWSKHYQMYSYIVIELQSIVTNNFPINRHRQAITGHSMGGHGALTIGLKHNNIYKSISAFAPICSPSQSPWGKKAFLGYLGKNEKLWDDYDATSLILKGKKSSEILIDQGDNDKFLASQLKPELFSKACESQQQPLNLRLQQGYDHSYFFIATFIEEHIRFHAEKLSSL